jgi:polyisoprenoid-binding protein YceI
MSLRLFASLVLWVAAPAWAADWAVQPGSTLGFVASYQGERFEGRFAKFSPQIRFDPANLAASRFDVAIVLASANTHNDERDDMLRGAEFFDTAKAPEARYLATKFRALGNHRYAADGTLSLRGVSKPVTLVFTWIPGDKPVLAGEATIKRLDFSIGAGEWADTELLPNEVTVKTRLLLAASTAGK